MAVWVVSELYHPEQTSTGHVMTRIAEGLAKTCDVSVACAQPTYARRGERAPTAEWHNGVRIHRAKSTTFDTSTLWGRVANAVTISVGVAAVLVRRLRRGDDVLVVTNPPTLPYVAAIAATMCRARVTLIVHDLYPEVLEVVTRGGTFSRLVLGRLDWLSRSLYRRVHSIVVIGPDQAERVAHKLAVGDRAKIAVIPLSFDVALDAPRQRSSSSFLASLPMAVQRKTLFQFAGNVGPLQGIESLLDAIGEQRSERAHFCFVGRGRASGRLEQRANSLEHVSVHPPIDRSLTADLHAGCDVVLISLVEGMLGISVPSRIGNALAAGRPILAVTDRGSTLDRLIEHHGVGWSVRPGDRDGFWAAVDHAVDAPDDRLRMGEAARRLAEAEYREETMLGAYRSLVGDAEAGGTAPRPPT